MEILERVFWGNTLREYIVAAAVFTAAIVLLGIIKKIVFYRLKKIVAQTGTDIDDLILGAVGKYLMPLLYISSAYLALQRLSMNNLLAKIIDFAMMIVLFFLGAQLVLSVMSIVLPKYWQKKGIDADKSNSLTFISFIIRVIVWSVAVLILLDNLGVKISGLLAGIGIGGIAIAFAAQAILGDVFNYFTIFMDRPFEIGDFIIVDNYLGVVEHIGVKTTRIRSLGGEELVFSNSDLTASRVRNYKKMYERRVSFTFGVTYDTPVEKLRRIPEEVKKIIESQEGARFDRAHFASFGDFSLNFEVVYYVDGSDYTKYMDIQQSMNLHIMETLEDMQVDFAYPTQTLFINKI